MDDVIFAHNVPFGGMSLDTDVVPSDVTASSCAGQRP